MLCHWFELNWASRLLSELWKVSSLFMRCMCWDWEHCTCSVLAPTCRLRCGTEMQRLTLLIKLNLLTVVVGKMCIPSETFVHPGTLFFFSLVHRLKINYSYHPYYIICKIEIRRFQIWTCWKYYVQNVRLVCDFGGYLFMYAILGFCDTRTFFGRFNFVKNDKV